MTVSLAERARQGRLIALRAIHLKQVGAEIVVLSDCSPEARPVFTSRRKEEATVALFAA